MSTRQRRHPSNRGVLQCHTREFQRAAIAPAIAALLSASAYLQGAGMAIDDAWPICPDGQDLMSSRHATRMSDESRPRDYYSNGRHHGITLRTSL